MKRKEKRFFTTPCVAVLRSSRKLHLTYFPWQQRVHDRFVKWAVGGYHGNEAVWLHFQQQRLKTARHARLIFGYVVDIKCKLHVVAWLCFRRKLGGIYFWGWSELVEGNWNKHCSVFVSIVGRAMTGMLASCYRCMPSCHRSLPFRSQNCFSMTRKILLNTYTGCCNCALIRQSRSPFGTAIAQVA